MSIKTYEFEGNTIVAPLQIRSNYPVFVNDSISLSQTRASQGAQRWELSFDLVMKDTEADALVGIVVYKDTKRTMEFPQLNSVNRKATIGAMTATGSAGDSSVSASFTGLLPKGSFIQFSSHSKVYLVTADVTGGGTVPIFPALLEAVSGTVATPTSEGVTLTYWKDDSTSYGITYEDGILASVQGISILEAL